MARLNNFKGPENYKEPILDGPENYFDEDAPPTPPKVVAAPIRKPVEEDDDEVPDLSLKVSAPKKENLSPPVASKPESKPSTPESDQKSGPDSYLKYLVTPQDLQQMQNRKVAANLVTGIGNALGNVNSVGNFYLGRLNQRHDVNPAPFMQQAEAPIEAKQSLLAQAMKKPQMDIAAQMEDPNSTATQLLKATALGAVSRLASSPLSQKDPDSRASFQQMKDTISKQGIKGSEIQAAIDSNPILKQELSTDAMGQRMLAMTALSQQRLGQGEDRIASSAADSINKHPNIVAYNQRLAQIATDDHTLSQPGVINPVVAHEISQGLANAFQGGKGAGWNASQATQIGGSQKALAEIQGWLSNKPYEALSPEQKAYTRQTLQRVKESYQQAQFNMANQLYKSKINAYSHTPSALQALKDARDQYAPGGSGEGGSFFENTANAGETGSPLQQAAMAELAKRQAAKGQSAGGQ